MKASNFRFWPDSAIVRSQPPRPQSEHELPSQDHDFANRTTSFSL
jgi:hypothetical protein